MAPRRPPRPNKPLYELDESEIARLNSEAVKRVAEERQKEAAKIYLEDAIEKERAKFDPSLELVEFKVDLPPYARVVIVNGIQYSADMVYTVPRALYLSIADVMARCWEHEKASGSPGLREYTTNSRYGVSASSGTAFDSLARV